MLSLEVLVMADASSESTSAPKSTVPLICCSQEATGTCLDSASVHCITLHRNTKHGTGVTMSVFTRTVMRNDGPDDEGC